MRRGSLPSDPRHSQCWHQYSEGSSPDLKDRALDDSVPSGPGCGQASPRVSVEEDAPVEDMSTSHWALVYLFEGTDISHLTGMHSRHGHRSGGRAVAGPCSWGPGLQGERQRVVSSEIRESAGVMGARLAGEGLKPDESTWNLH